MITALRHPPPTPPPEAVAEPVVVVSQNYLAPYVIDLNVTRKMMMLMEGSTISVNDIYGDQWFKVRGKMLSLRDRRVLFDIANNPLVTFQHKVEIRICFMHHCSRDFSKQKTWFVLHVPIFK
ncbi:unnamed protein product [Cuscuta europaea]|uniref:Uncharacterized protein n=1 Tax=Cuscuta europaea TaxID=41803 RepID=A0A9P1EFP7_CUSEU|nr:unnamed protein product [Cuscuta europaea]